MLQPLSILTQIWSDISDGFFIGGFPKAFGVDTTKFSYFMVVASTFTAKEVSEIFIRDMVTLHGFPSSIVSDKTMYFLALSGCN